MVSSFLLVVFVIAFSIIIFLGLTFNWLSTERDRVDSLDCNELWEEILEHEKEFGTLGDRVFAKWITKECWS